MDHLRDALRRFLADEPYRRLPDDELWARFRDRGEEGAFRVFLEKTGGIVYALSQSVLKNDAEAEEAFQETYCALFRDRAKLGSYPAAVAWLIETAKNKARMHRRWRLRQTWREWRKAAAGSTATPDEAACGLADREQREAVIAALAGLPTRERRAVELVYLAGMTHTEAADALGWSRGAVGTYVQRGLERLRGQLARAGLAVAGVAAVEATLRACVPPLAPERLAKLGDALLLRTGTFASAAGGSYWLSGWKPTAVVLTAVGTAAGVWWKPPAPAPAPAPVPSPAPPPAVAPAPAESLAARNLRLFEADVRPRLQAALDSLVTGEGGSAVITGVETQGTRIWLTAELRHGKPQRHTSRLALQYCTLNRRRMYLIDTWGDGVVSSVNPRDPITLSKNRVGAPDLTRPLTGFRDVHAALEMLPADPGGNDVAAREQDAIRRVAWVHRGTWYCRGHPSDRVEVKFDPVHDPLTFYTPRNGQEARPQWMDYWWLPDGRLSVKYLGRHLMTLSTDGTRIDFPQAGVWWVREPAQGRGSPDGGPGRAGM